MENGQPPSWRPDVEQARAEAYRGTVRDALGGLRNLEQLLGSLRVGPRALASVLPDVRASCPALGSAIDGLATIVDTKLTNASSITAGLRKLAHEKLESLSKVIESVERQTLNAKNRLRLEEAVADHARDLDAIVELVDLLGEVAWGRTMSLDLSEVAREAFRSSEAPGTPQPAVRLILRADLTSGERIASPRALVLVFHHLVRWSIERVPQMTPIVSLCQLDSQDVELVVRQGDDSGEMRWAPGRRVLGLTEDALRLAASAMGIELEFEPSTGRVRALFPSQPSVVS